MKYPDFFKSLGLQFPGMPRLQLAGENAPLHFSASRGGGGGDYDDAPDDDFYDDYEEEPAPRSGGDETRQPTAGRRRTVQSQPDDRYWTDYLRIALPVIGLLLVIAVFWFWAQQLIDDPEDDLVSPTEAPGLAEVVDDSAQVPTDPQQEVVATPPVQQEQQQQTQAPVVTPTPVVVEQQPAETDQGEVDTAEGADQQVIADPDEGADEQVIAEPEQAEGEPAAGGIGPDSTVVVTEQLNLRSEPTLAADNIVTVLDAGTELTVLSGPTEAEGYIWWEVTDQAGNIGWVAEEFIEPAG
ncbi:MAG TPA: SH3 domain-containing protein [Thermomicrobiales bacterium]|nr:SH3 domain-containing protein [Thermomicrobiales bacterium]